MFFFVSSLLPEVFPACRQLPAHLRRSLAHKPLVCLKVCRCVFRIYHQSCTRFDLICFFFQKSKTSARSPSYTLETWFFGERFCSPSPSFPWFCRMSGPAVQQELHGSTSHASVWQELAGIFGKVQAHQYTGTLSPPLIFPLAKGFGKAGKG